MPTPTSPIEISRRWISDLKTALAIGDDAAAAVLADLGRHVADEAARRAVSGANSTLAAYAADINKQVAASLAAAFQRGVAAGRRQAAKSATPTIAPAQPTIGRKWRAPL